MIVSVDRHDVKPMREFFFGPYDSVVERRANGSFLITSTDPLRSYPLRYTERLLHWAAIKPDTVFLAQRGPDGQWSKLNYGEAASQIRHLAQALLDKGLSTEKPLVILSENSLEVALLSLAAMHVGIPFAPISPAYSLLSANAERVRHAISLLTPGVVYARDALRYGNAIKKAVPKFIDVWFSEGGLPGWPCTNFRDVQKTHVTPAVDEAYQNIAADTIAKFLFTSGSTSLPKAVVNTHGMLTSNQQMFAQCFPSSEDTPPVLVDWLPWHHTAGGNHNFGLVLYNGGTLYIDEGKPTPGEINKTIRNLKEISPTVYYSVPKGLDVLVQAMQNDKALRDNFFKRLSLIFPCGAALSAPLQVALDEQAVISTNARIPMATSLGMTETAPFALSAHTEHWQAGMIGIPAPGLEVKLAPCADKLEVRYRGPNITSGYWRQPELTQDVFDDEGFLRSGDAATFHDVTRLNLGLKFDGRIAEDFKLLSGTWVNVGALRQKVIGLGAPYIHDVVITGHDRDQLGMFVFLLPFSKYLTGYGSSEMPLAQIAVHPKVRNWAQTLLNTLADSSTSSSQRIMRAIIMIEPASLERGEITDKGSINQRSVLTERKSLIEYLYSERPENDVFIAQNGLDD